MPTSSAPRSLADADRRARRPRNWKRPAAAAVTAAALVAAAVGGYVALHTEDGLADTSPLADAPLLREDGKAVQLGKPIVIIPANDDQPASEVPPVMRQVRVDLLVDGWSAATLRDLHLRWAPAGATEYKPVTLEKVTRADVAEIQRTTPGALTATLARQVTGDSSLACSPSGCRTSDGAVNLEVLNSPKKVKGFGESYAGWHVDSLLYRASLNVPAGAASVVLRADGFYDESLPTIPTAEAGTAPDAANGYLRNRYLVGAGLGSFFAVDPSWADGKDGVTRWRTEPVSGVDEDVVATVKANVPDIAAVGGLATPWEPARRLTSSHLTYLTSPVTGCGVGVLCAPDRVQANVVARSKDTAVACPEGGQLTPNVAVLDNVRITAKLKAPIHQRGVYGGKDPQSFDGYTGKGINGGGQPVLTRDSIDIRWAVVGLIDTPDAVLRTMAGRTDSAGSGELAAPVSIGDVLANVKFDGASWGACG